MTNDMNDRIQIFEDIDKYDIHFLARYTLRHTNFSVEGNSLSISDRKILKKLWSKFSSWALDTVHSSDLSREEKELIFKDNERFMYFFTRKVPCVESVATIMLWYQIYLPKEYIYNGGLLAVLWIIANIYAKDKEIEFEDYSAIMKMYEYVIKLFDKLYEIGELEDMERIEEMKILAFKSLSDILSKLYEFDKSTEICKEALLLSNSGNNGVLKEGDLIIRIAENYKEINISEAIIFITEILNNDFSKLPNFTAKLGNRIETALEIILLDIISENENITNDILAKFNFKSSFTVAIFNIITKIREGDNNLDNYKYLVDRVILEYEKFEIEDTLNNVLKENYLNIIENNRLKNINNQLIEENIRLKNVITQICNLSINSLSASGIVDISKYTIPMMKTNIINISGNNNTIIQDTNNSNVKIEINN